MTKYHKIDSMFKRDMDNGGKIIVGKWAVPEIEYLKDNEWEFTEKVDGTNIRVYYAGGKIIYGGRTDNAQIPVVLINALDQLFRTPEGQTRLDETFPDGDVVLYGEGYGAKIQNGGKYLDHADFVLFDVMVGGWYLKRDDVLDVATKLNLVTVPVVGRGTLHEGIELVRDRGLKSAWGDFPAEGIVARPTTELFTRRGARIITKIKARDFR